MVVANWSPFFHSHILSEAYLWVFSNYSCHRAGSIIPLPCIIHDHFFPAAVIIFFPLQTEKKCRHPKSDPFSVHSITWKTFLSWVLNADRRECVSREREEKVFSFIFCASQLHDFRLRSASPRSEWVANLFFLCRVTQEIATLDWFLIPGRWARIRGSHRIERQQTLSWVLSVADKESIFGLRELLHQKPSHREIGTYSARLRH